MKIAIPTDDRVNMAAHFGRAAEFAIFSVDGNEVSEPEYRKNEHSHGAGQGHEHGTGQGQGRGQSQDFHGPLAGVNVILCGGMGQRAQQALEEMGIQALFCSPGKLEQLTTAFAEETLKTGEPSCDRRH